MFPRLFVSTLLLAFASGVTAQNLVKNGDFENGVTHWQYTGGKFYANVEARDCNGDGRKSSAFVVAPDHSANLFQLTQDLSMKRGTAYWLRIAVRGEGNLPAPNRSSLEVVIGSAAFQYSQYLGVANIHRDGKGLLYDYSIPFTPSGDWNWITLRFFTASRASLGFGITLDDVEVYPMAGRPWIANTTDRQNQPTSLGTRTYGQPGALYLVALGTKLLPQEVPIPGFGGALELDLTGGFFLLGNGVLNAQGFDDWALHAPAAVFQGIRNTPLYWMPIEVTSLPATISLGKPGPWSFQ